MRRFRVVIEIPFINGEIVEDFEVEDDATDEDIAAEAKDIFANTCNYGFHEISEADQSPS